MPLPSTGPSSSRALPVGLFQRARGSRGDALRPAADSVVEGFGKDLPSSPGESALSVALPAIWKRIGREKKIFEGFSSTPLVVEEEVRKAPKLPEALLAVSLAVRAPRQLAVAAPGYCASPRKLGARRMLRHLEHGLGDPGRPGFGLETS